MEDREDNSYLKQYVKSHPDNQMAWYLLGKDYLLQGKEAKANYCFLQAGDVYEAYEKRRHELDTSKPEEAIRTWNRKRRLKSTAARTAAAAVLLLLLSLVAPEAPDSGQDGTAGREPQELKLLSPEGVGVVFVPPAAAREGQALETLLFGQGTGGYGLAVKLEQEGSWRTWTGQQRVLLSVERPPGSSNADVAFLDAQSCNCTPADATKAYGTLSEWKGQREQQWVLMSAIRRYYERHKTWPDSLYRLVRPFPNNLLSGDTPEMREMFEGALRLAQAAAEGKPAPPKGGGEQGNNEGAAGSDPGVLENGGLPDGLPTKPLEIIVDTSSYRLALVSGDVVVRSYRVGLGGPRTPKGNFAVSVKVRNPNGRDDGDFGSRGMQLSDTLYAIHGTNEPDSIGKDESLGCIRMLKEDVEELFDMTPLGTKVTIKSGVLPGHVTKQQERFRLAPQQDETNPAKVYRWLT